MPMNDMQYLAAYGEFDKDVLVSAGAGSGKTHVLTSRVTDLIVNKHIRPTNLLVLTFTNAAAAEMKDRVRAMLGEKNSDPTLIDELEQAYITTFDSFNLSMCRKYFYALNISPNIGVCDAQTLKMKKIEILEDILAELYKVKDKELEDYLNYFTDKRDDSLIIHLLSLINSIDKKEDSIAYLNSYDSCYFSEDFLKEIKQSYQKLLTSKNMDLIQKLNELIKSTGTFDSAQILVNMISEISSNDYLRTKQALDIELPKKNKKTDDEKFSPVRAECVKCINDLKSYYEYDSIDGYIEEYKKTYSTISLFKKILLKYYEKINAYMAKYDLYEFNDIQKLAIKLVSEHDEIREEMKAQFKEILIDEYQDTSDLQESFISYFKNNNRFMVGDIKQSIYRFRNANPNIFKQKYETYVPINKDVYPSSKEQFKDSAGYLIDMNQNFRSRSEVLDDINNIFTLLMTNEVGDAKYLESHQMSFGFTKYNEQECSEAKGFNCDFITYPYNPKEAKGGIDYYEGYIIAKDILSKVNNYMVYSKDEKIFRKAKFDDFCIILDRQDHFEVFKRVLEYYNIPVVINADQSINESYQSMAIVNCLKLIDCHKNNSFNSDYYHALASVLRSYLFELKDDEILRIVRGRNLDNVASNIARELSYMIDKTDNVMIFNEALEKYGFYKNVIKLANINEALHEAEFLANKINDLAKMGYSFSKSVEFLSELITNNPDAKYSLDVSSFHGVKMMNIHKSKGLEFPICYFADFNHSYNSQNIKASVGLNNQYGIYAPVYDEGVKSTIIKNLSDDMWVKATVSERLRLFYVALTRAREKMIFIRTMDKQADAIPTNLHKSFGDYFDYIVDKAPGILKNKIELNEEFFNDLDINKIISKRYNLNLGNHIIPKYENLDLDKSLVAEGHISKRINKVIDSKSQKILDSGTRYHEILELVDFTRPLESLATLFASEDDKKIVRKVLEMDLLKNIHLAKTYHEHEFIYKVDSSVYHGIIDLLVIYDDHVEIIDYKLKHFDDEAYDRQLGLYYSFVKSKTNKPIKCYLLSIIDANYREVKVK